MPLREDVATQRRDRTGDRLVATGVGFLMDAATRVQAAA